MQRGFFYSIPVYTTSEIFDKVPSEKYIRMLFFITSTIKNWTDKISSNLSSHRPWMKQGEASFYWQLHKLVDSIVQFFYVHSCWRNKTRSEVTLLNWRQYRKDKLPLFIGLAWIRGACLSETVASSIKLLQNWFCFFNSFRNVVASTSVE